MHLEYGKRDHPSVNTANDDGLASHRIFVMDRYSKISFLVDTGADICVYPRNKIHGAVNRNEYELFAANGTRIATYGTIAINLNLSLRWAFKWRFTVVDVQTPIIGMDFLSRYGLLVDPRNRRLLDITTQLSSMGYAATADEISIITINGESVYHQLLAEFPDITSTHLIDFNRLKRSLKRSSSKAWRRAESYDYVATIVHWTLAPYPTGTRRHISKTSCNIYMIRISFQKSILFAHIIKFRLYLKTIEKTAITTPFGLFEATNMMFGLRNTAQTCQRFVDEITHGLDFVYAYIDDFLIASEDGKQHCENLRILFNRFDDYGVVINRKKCEFGAHEITFLRRN